MTDELKQWEYDKGYDKGKADMLKAIEDIKAEITSCERDVEYMDSYSDGYNRGLFESLQIIDKHIGEVSE